MTVTQSYSLSLTYTSLRTYVPQVAPASVPTSSGTKPAPASDTVTLRPEATTTPAEAPQRPVAPASRAAQRAEMLLNALDADQDGAVTREEFLDRAMALLRRAGARHHHRHQRMHEEHQGRGHENHGMRRLENELDSLSYPSVTVVIAVKQYASVAAMKL